MTAPAALPPHAVAAEVAPASPAASARPEPAPNAIHLEVLGNGLLYSLNYERMFPRQNIGLRAGFGFVTYKISNAYGAGNLTFASLPLVASYYLGTPHHKLQLGLGVTVLWVDAASDSTNTKFEGSGTGLGVAATGVVGYRYLPTRDGLTFGAGFTPLARPEKGFLPWGGAFVGYAF
jgi:hypothetical protein